MSSAPFVFSERHPHLPCVVARADFWRSIGAAFVLVIALTVVVGWVLQVRSLASFYPGWVTMKVNTALGLGLSAATVLLLGARDGVKGRQTQLTRTLAVLVVGLGAVTLAQYAVGVDLGIDQIVLRATFDLGHTVTPGRMAAVTAVAFVLLGASLLTVGVDVRGHRPAQPLAVATGALGLTAVLGFVGPGQGLQIATHTAFALVVLAAGILTLETEVGWMPTVLSPRAGGVLARRLLPVAVAVPLVLGALRQLSQSLALGDAVTDGAFVAAATMCAFGVLIWRTARALNEADEQWHVTERAAREKDEALALLDLVLDSSPVGFALFGRDLRFRRVNRALAEANGAPAAAHIGRTVRDIAPDDADAVEANLKAVLANGEPLVNAERVTGTAPRGRRHWLSTKFPVRSPAGDIIGVGMNVVETTDRKQLQEQLQQAQKMEAVGQLAGGVAHDFNNVLTAIKSFSEIVALDLPEDSPLRDDVAEISAAADRAAALTRQLLAFSRSQVLQPVVLDVNRVVEGIGKLLERLIGSEVNCKTVLAPALGRSLADPGQLEQVLMNLAVNARDAMPDGGTLTIETANVALDADHASQLSGAEPAAPGDYVMIAVSDTGLGMDRATQNRIFEPFFTTKDPGKGTGLGLSTVYGIVRQSGGYVSVYSEVGRGTTFRVYLPRTRADLQALGTKSAKAAVQNGSETILIVDDDAGVRMAASRILARAGYTVLTASTPAEAVTIWTEHPGHFNLLMTDLMMPEMDGGELAQILLATRPAARVLYTSGYTSETVVRRGHIMSEMPFLPKPFTMDDLVSTVREALAREQTNATPK